MSISANLFLSIRFSCHGCCDLHGPCFALPGTESACATMIQRPEHACHLNLNAPLSSCWTAQVVNLASKYWVSCIDLYLEKQRASRSNDRQVIQPLLAAGVTVHLGYITECFGLNLHQSEPPFHARFILAAKFNILFPCPRLGRLPDPV